MDAKEFTLKWRHEVEGWVLDAATTQRSGTALSLFLRQIRAKIENKLGAMYADIANRNSNGGIGQ